MSFVEIPDHCWICMLTFQPGTLRARPVNAQAANPRTRGGQARYFVSGAISVELDEDSLADHPLFQEPPHHLVEGFLGRLVEGVETSLA